MSVNGINGSVTSAYPQNNTAAQTKTDAVSTSKKEDVAAVYESNSTEKTASTAKTYTADLTKVNTLKAELAQKKQQMQKFVESVLGKQANKSSSIFDLLNGLKNGTIEVDPAVSAQAQKDIGEDGYWGVEQTSDRLVEMAKALSGGDPDKADEMIAAMKKGFEQATKAFGDELPEICKKTIDAAEEKMNKWKTEQTPATAK